MAPNNHHHHRPSTSRRKKTSPPAPAPPPPPPQLSSDDDCDDEVSESPSSSEEDKEDQAPPLAQQSKEDDDSSSEDEEQAPALAPPPAQHYKEDDYDSSSDDDDDNDASEFEPEQPAVLTSNQNTPLPAIVAPLPPLGATAIIDVENDHDHDHSVLAEVTPGERSKNKLKRVWTPAMLVMLMEKAVDYSERHGNCNISKANIADFRSSLLGCPIYEPSEEQILAKIRDVRKNHDNPNGMGKGNRRQFDPTIAELVELSKRLWGADGSGSDSGKKRKKPGGKDLNPLSLLHRSVSPTVAFPVSPRPPSEEKREGVGGPRTVVYISTSLDTDLALDVGRSDTVADLKKNMMLAHMCCFPSYGEIKIDAVKFNCRGHFYCLCDSMLLRVILDGMKTELFLYVEVSISEEHLDERVEEEKEEAVVKGASSLGPRGTDDEETIIEELLENALIVPGQVVVVDDSQISGVPQKCPELGDNSREFIVDEATQGVAGAFVCEPVAGVVGDKPPTTKRKKSAPKNESSSKQDTKDKKNVPKHDEGSETAISLADPKIPNKAADLEKRPLKRDPKEKTEPKNLVVICLKGAGSLDKAKEPVDGDGEVNSQEKEIVAVQQTKKNGKRKHGSIKSTKQAGKASSSTEKTMEKISKCTTTSAVPNSDKEGETQSAVDIVRNESDLGMSENIGLILMEVAKETVSGESSKKEGRKAMNKKRRSTLDCCSVAVENSSKPNGAGNDITSSPTLITSPRQKNKKATKIQ